MEDRPGDAAQRILGRVREFLGRTFLCTCGQVHRIPTREVIVGPGAVEELQAVAKRHLPAGSWIVVADATTAEVAGERVAEVLSSRLEVLPPNYLGDRLVCDEAAVRHAEAAIAGYAAAVAVGAGTVNDTVKLACHRRGIPYIAVATAASMNGYPSAIAAVYERGLKRTVPAEPPVAVVADMDIVAAAPAELTRAGLGDLSSKPVSSADWLAAQILKGDLYCQTSVGLADDAEVECRRAAASIGAGEPEAVATLMAGLIASGLSMAIAGSSAPASGGEHLISHLWDMRRHLRGRPLNLHGAQVGVTTLISAALWQMLKDSQPPDEERIREIIAKRPSPEQEAEHISKRLGELAEPAVEQYLQKRPSDEELEARLTFLSHTWPRFWAHMGSVVREPGEIAAALKAAGAPTTIAELDISADEALSAVLDARYIRNRYTVLDLAADLGLLEELAPRAIEESGVLG